MTATRTVRPRKWAPYGACGICPAVAGQPCLDMRTVVAGHHPARPLASPHTGRRREK